MSEAPVPEERSYAFVEGLHLRQGAMRVVLPLAALAANGAGPFEVTWLPRHDAVPLPPAAAVLLRAAGGVLVVASAVLRVKAKGVLVRKTTLTTDGVYGVCRHPFYLANLAGAVGTLLLAGPLGAAVAAAWLVLAAPVYAVTIRGEDAALRRLYPAQFERYAASVAALLPGRPPATCERQAVTWRNLVAEREPPRLLRFLAGAVIVVALTLTGSASHLLLAAAALAFGASYGLR